MLKLFDRNWLAIVMLLTIAALPVRIQASSPTVVFSEIAWAGSSISSSDEWIELANLSDNPVDLSGWILSGAGSSGADLVLPDGAQIDPHSTYVIANYEHTHANSALESAPDFVIATLSLSNNGFSLTLYDALGTLVDVAGGSGTPFAGGSGGTGDSVDGRYRSMVRNDGLGDGSLEGSWAGADTSSGFKAEIEDLGTPGVIAFANIIVESEPVAESDPAAESDEPIIESEPMTEPEQATEVETGEVVEEPEPTTELREETIEVIVNILISEFVVDPNEGENEWIELVNISSESLDLTGWTVEDATEKQTVLQGNIEADGYIIIDSPLGKLNNDTDSILLKDSTGALVDFVEYGTDDLKAPNDGAALARGASGSFELTYTATPGEINVIDPEKPNQTSVIPSEVDSGADGSPSEKIAEQEDPSVDEKLLQDNTDTPVVVTEKPIIEESVTDVRISEFVVDPSEDGVEWIELYNGGDSPVILEGWSIEDATGKATDLSTVTIDAGAYVVVKELNGKLNNDGDSIILKDSSNQIVETIVYGSDGYNIPEDGEALARNGETFEITELTTPGSANLISVALEEIGEEPSSGVIQSPDALVGVEESQVEIEVTEEVEPIKTLRFVTLYPNATGSDEEEEYIMIENTGTEVIDLLDWSIQDRSTKSFTFQDPTNLAAGATIRVDRPQTKIVLNNGGDTLELIAPDGDVVDLVTYGTSAKGATYDFVNGTWKWSGTAMVAESTVTESTTTSTPMTTSTTATVSNSINPASTTSTASSRVAQSVTIAQAKEKTDGQNVIVKGIVTSAPGTFGRQIFYLQDETGGIQAYLYSGDFPELALGDVIQVTGELSTNRGERRVKLSSAASVVPARIEFGDETIKLAIDELEGLLVGILMTTQGQIQSIDTNKLVIEHAGATLMIYLKSNPVIDAQQFERGDKIEVTGVLTSYDGELRLRPRSDNDITVVEEASVASVVTTESSGDSNAGMILLITTMAALVALALWRYLPRRRLTPTAA